MDCGDVGGKKQEARGKMSDLDESTFTIRNSQLTIHNSKYTAY